MTQSCVLNDLLRDLVALGNGKGEYFTFDTNSIICKTFYKSRRRGVVPIQTIWVMHLGLMISLMCCTSAI